MRSRWDNIAFWVWHVTSHDLGQTDWSGELWSQIILKDHESTYLLLLEEAHQITFHQRYINSLMIEVFRYLNGHSPVIMNDIFKLRENMYNLWNFHIFQTDNRRSLKYVLDTIPYCASQLWQQVPIDIREAASLALFKNPIKTWKCEDCPLKPCKIFIKMSGISNWSPLVTVAYVWGTYAYRSLL